MMKLIYNALTGEESMEEVPDVEQEIITPLPTLEEQLLAMKIRLAIAEQAASENSATQQMLIELLIDAEVI